MHACLYMHTCKHTHIIALYLHARKYTCKYTYAMTYIHASIYVRAQMRTRTYADVPTFIYTCTDSCTNAISINIYIHMYTRVRMYIHACGDIHTQPYRHAYIANLHTLTVNGKLVRLEFGFRVSAVDILNSTENPVTCRLLKCTRPSHERTSVQCSCISKRSGTRATLARIYTQVQMLGNLYKCNLLYSKAVSLN